jgi:selenocysteine lyase/cysteine desulfurase
MTERRKFIKQSAFAALAFISKPVHTRMELNHVSVDETDRKNLSWSKIRSEFPLEKSPIYLNNGTMGPSPKSVINAIKKSIDYTNRTGVYGGGEPEAIQSLSRFLMVEQDELALTHNVTEGINITAFGLLLKTGDEIIVTKEEHVGNGLPWLQRARYDHLKVVAVDLGNTADETLANIKKAVTSRTRVIAVPHVTCTNGQVLPVKEICAFARQNDIYSCIDGAHGTGMMPLNLHDMGCDTYASCCHKWLLGPKGTGYLYVRKELQDELQALFVGGHSGLDWNVHHDEPFLDDHYLLGAHRYFYGTQDAASYFGIEAAVAFCESIGIERINSRIRELNEYLFQELKNELGRISILTPEESQSRCGVVAFRIKDVDNSIIVSKMKDAGYILRHVAESEKDSIRVSTHMYNSESEIDALLACVKRQF